LLGVSASVLVMSTVFDGRVSGLPLISKLALAVLLSRVPGGTASADGFAVNSISNAAMTKLHAEKRRANVPHTGLSGKHFTWA